jgi:FkbM family methyltransferase
VGSNIGFLTVPVARAVGPSGTVFAIEPQAGIFRLLAVNTLLNGVLKTRLFSRRQRFTKRYPVLASVTTVKPSQFLDELH